MKKSKTDIQNKPFPILQTKLFVPPPRPDQVQRPRLIGQLNQGISRKLTLVSAPAGFGKTTLLSEWIAQSDMPIAWISLDNSDCDPVQFTHYLIATLRNIHPDIGETALSQLQSSQRPPVESVLISLIQEVTELAEELIIVFDDYHAIDTDNIHKLIKILLDFLPTQVHLVISSRVDPPLPLARLRASKQLSELRTAHLCFTDDEAAAFFNQIMDLHLSSEDISVLESRTEGWIAGLQLAAISMQGREDISSFIQSFAGDDRHIVDYLVEEVLNLQTEPVQNFLLQTSILNRLSEPLCKFVTGEKGSQEILDELERANLFIVPLDDKRHWYRYHHLFAELLQQRLRLSEGDLVNALHKKASRWYQDQGIIDEAVNHAFEAHDYEQAAQLIGEYVKYTWEYDARMSIWHKKLPLEFIRKDPELSFFNAWMIEKSGQYDVAEEHLDATEQLISAQLDETSKKTTDSLPEKFDVLRGKIAAIRANIALYRNDTPAVVRFAEKAMKLLQHRKSSWGNHTANILGQAFFFREELGKANQIFKDVANEGKLSGDYFSYLKGRLGVASILRSRGDLPGAIEIYKELYQIAEERGLLQSPMIGWLYLNWGKILGYQNYINEALQYIQQGLNLSKPANDAAMTGEGHFNLVAVLLTKGDLVAAEAIIEKTETLAEQTGMPLLIVNSLETLKVRIWLDKGSLKPALKWMAQQKTPEDGKSGYLPFPKRMLFSRILFADGKTDNSLELLKPLAKIFKGRNWAIEQIEVLLIRSKIYQSRGELSEAISLLQKAVALAEPGGIISIFVDEGPSIAELLQMLLEENTDIPRAFVNKVLSAFRLTKLMKTDDGIFERLSERELEVLRLIASGLPNKTITEELFISLSTVKTHIRNIYSKLDVNSRTQAAAKAKDLDLL